MGDEEISNSEQLLEAGLRLGASDIHIDPLTDGFILRARVDGKLMELRRVSRAAGVLLGNQLKADAGIDPGANFVPRSSRRAYSFAGRAIDIRITLAPCASGEKIAIRLLDPDRVKHHIDDLGLEPEGLKHLKDWLGELNGLFLVSGPTNSGKTTTLYALLHEMAKLGEHVLTIEDPVEYEIDGINQIQVDRHHGLDFAAGLRSMLRLDPDYMMVGELRDAETVEVAASAATSGHVLLSTIHSRDAVSAITALRNYGMGGNQIAATAAVIVNQRLVRRLCPHCRIAGIPISGAERSWLIEHGVAPSGNAWAPAGCRECHGLGYSGRCGIFEIWRPGAADYDMLLAGADERSIRRRLKQHRHQTLVADGWEKIRHGTTSLEEIRQATGGLRTDD